ncbi:MAG: MBL fold metallo-hydrolase [Bacteroidaceae bacterium]|nr:MBL fold metallo-hydrolase [Bacteroidaceae bacterium]
MSKEKGISRRHFLQSSALLTAGTIVPTHTLARETGKGKSSFTMWQIPSHRNTIGNSYVFRTRGGKVVVMDGGFPEEEFTLRGFLGALGNEVDAWFISHPHDDHMGALCQILKDVQDLRIRHIYHSRLTDEVTDAEPHEAKKTRAFYKLLDEGTIPVTDIQQAGHTYDFDGMQLKILSTATGLTNNAYNNNSMIMRVWDRRKAIVFLGDAGVECGDLMLRSPYRDDLNCDYLQMAHHGQQGCSEAFYRSFRFRACLWPTPMWVWNNDTGNGYNTGHLKTIETRLWMDRLGIKEHHVSVRDGLFRLD